MTLNLANLFEAVAAAVPDRPALTCGERQLTFAQLDARANAFANHLVSAGIGPGQHVGIYMLNEVEYVEAMLGCFKARAVPVNINYRYTEHELLYLFNDAELGGIVVADEFAGNVASLVDQCSHLAHVVVVTGTEPHPAPAWSDRVSVVDYDKALSVQPTDAPLVDERTADDTLVLYTGGTTGMPKGVVWRHEDFYFAALTGGNPYGPPHLTPEALAEGAVGGFVLTYLIPIPLMHGAASYTLLTALLGGSHVVLLTRFDPVDVLRVIERHKVQVMSVVGDAIVRPIVDALRRHKSEFDLSSLLHIGSGGAIFSAAVQDELREQLPALSIGNSFGASESGVDGKITVGEDGLMRLEPTPAVRVVDSARRTVSPGSEEVGFVARSGHVPLAYYNDPQRTATTFPVIDGVRWSILGDVARVEADGTIVVLGRGSGCINSGGEKVFPEEVEQALKAHPAVMDVLVAGVPDERFGQRVGAVVELREDASSVTAEELRDHCRTMIAGYKVPSTIKLVDRVVRSPTGKADYRWASSALAGSR